MNAFVYCETRSVVLRLNLSSVAGHLGKALKWRDIRSDSMRGVGTNMCSFVDLSQLQDYMLTLVKNAYVYSRLPFTKK